MLWALEAIASFSAGKEKRKQQHSFFSASSWLCVCVTDTFVCRRRRLLWLHFFDWLNGTAEEGITLLLLPFSFFFTLCAKCAQDDDGNGSTSALGAANADDVSLWWWPSSAYPFHFLLFPTLLHQLKPPLPSLLLLLPIAKFLTCKLTPLAVLGKFLWRVL